MGGGVTPFYLVETRENTMCFEEGLIILERDNIMTLLLCNFLTFISFEGPMGMLTWYLFFFYMSL
jgi:hypothetical protein